MKRTLLLLSLLLNTLIYGQIDQPRFQKLLAESPNTQVPFVVDYSNQTLKNLLNDPAIRLKNATKNWIYIQATPLWIQESMKSGKIGGFVLEFAPPVALNDSTLVKHYVNEVHAGMAGLPLTGQNVIIGYVDQGLDYTHGDFIDALGNTRVLYYWDHTEPTDATAPLPYGYGRMCTQAQIQAGTCGSIENGTAHGTSVAGAGSSNGLDNGTQKGVAPDSKIIIVETNFNLPNWTLTIADACDFIFKKADELNMPAVVNLSLGSYLGSHDGDDPAAELIEQLLDEQGGRIVVCAAGNSGSWGNYHVRGDIDTDTSFVWAIPNPGSQLGANTIYMDLWSDLSEATWNYGFGANLSSGTFEERAETGYRLATFGDGTTVYDTLWNGTNRIATIEIYPNIEGNLMHLEVFFSTVDSTNYIYSFKTTGSGSYDAWTGSTAGFALNDMVETVPSAAIYPPIIHYNSPDSLQTIVSSWNCSEKVVTTGNIRNRFNHIDKNGNTYAPSPLYNTQVGQRSIASSRGPSRKGEIKPNVMACGDITLSAAPIPVLTNPGWWSSVDQDGRHIRNGGTSMASPVVAGVAALYLERCPKGTYQEFLNAIENTSFTDAFTGAVPNIEYGWGKIHALDLVKYANRNALVDYCTMDSIRVNDVENTTNIQWMNSSTLPSIPFNANVDFYYTGNDAYGCKIFSDTVNFASNPAAPTPVITVTGNNLSVASYPTIQWFQNGSALIGETGTTYTMIPPAIYDIYVSFTSADGCVAFSDTLNSTATISTNNFDFGIYPNPTNGKVQIESSEEILTIQLLDLNGKLLLQTSDKHLDLTNFTNGIYLIEIQTISRLFKSKIIKSE
jgi:Subtilase family/Secretion system C-terminal sorting domain